MLEEGACLNLFVDRRRLVLYVGELVRHFVNGTWHASLRHLSYRVVRHSHSSGFEELTANAVLRVREDGVLRPVTHNIILGWWEFDRLFGCQVCEVVLLLKLVDRDRWNFRLVEL